MEEKEEKESATTPQPQRLNEPSRPISVGKQQEGENNWPSFHLHENMNQEPPRRPVVGRIPEVLNLSKKQLSEEEKQVLQLGLRFAPTPRKMPDPLEFFEQFQDSCLRAYNKAAGTREAPALPAVVAERVSSMRDRLEKTAEQPAREEDKGRWLNMSSLHKRTLFALREDRTRTIKQADKGSCIVVQDTEDYIKEGLAFLDDLNTYEELQEDPLEQTARSANELLSKFKKQGLINGYTENAHRSDLKKVKEQRIYFLKKVHKTPMKLRPIVSCCSGPTQGISKLANTILSTYLDSVPSLVRDSTQVINCLESLKLSKKSCKSLTLVTLDVKNLYPSIPQALGSNMALQQAIPTFPPASKENKRKTMLKQMLKLVLEGNTFGFAGKHFRQKKGVAMGTPVAPTLVNLFMGKVEAEALSSWEGTQPLVWLRFIDDILVLMESTKLEMQQLVSHCNERMATIQYTAKVSDTQVNFLDVTIFKGPRFETFGTLDIKTFAKAIDPHSYLHFTSANHISIKTGVLSGEFIRMLRRSSSPGIYVTACIELTQWFMNRGNPTDLIKEKTHDINYGDRQRHLTSRNTKTLEDCTTILRVRQHPAISSKAIYTALEDLLLPFENRVVRPRPTTIGQLITKAATDDVSSSYQLRSSVTTSSAADRNSSSNNIGMVAPQTSVGRRLPPCHSDLRAMAGDSV